MTYALKTADAKFLMTAPSSMQVAIAAAKNVGIPKDRIFLLEGKLEGFSTIKELIEVGRGYGEQGQINAFKIPEGKKNKDICGFLSFSSGTTGLPKAVRFKKSSGCPGFLAGPYSCRATGHDRSPECHRTMSSNTTNHAS